MKFYEIIFNYATSKLHHVTSKEHKEEEFKGKKWHEKRIKQFDYIERFIAQTGYDSPLIIIRPPENTFLFKIPGDQDVPITSVLKE